MSRSLRFFKGKTVYISGGSSGIGRAAAELLAPYAAHIVLIARDTDKLSQARQALAVGHAEITTIAVDVSDGSAVAAAMKRTVRRLGAPDVIVHSAGYAFPGTFETLGRERLQRIIDINVFGTWNILHALVPQLTRGAIIIHIASFAALLGIFGYSGYAASKYASLGLCEVLRNELSPRGIAVKVVCPSDTDTPQLAYENRYKPPETKVIAGTVKPYTAAYVAHYLLTHCRRRAFLIIPGAFPKVLWALKRLWPSFVYRTIDRKIASGRGA